MKALKPTLSSIFLLILLMVSALINHSRQANQAAQMSALAK